MQVVAGANQIDAAQTGVVAVAGTGVTPDFALDVAQLGGMYAGKITLIGTEAGLGVRNAGVIGASAGNVVVQSNGWLRNTGSIQASGAGGSPADVQLAVTGDVQNSGTTYASGNTAVTTAGNLTHSGMIAAQGHTTLTANGAASRIDISSASVTASGMNADGSLIGTGDLQVQATGTVSMHGYRPRPEQCASLGLAARADGNRRRHCCQPGKHQRA
jgi:hypothetical protein